MWTRLQYKLAMCYLTAVPSFLTMSMLQSPIDVTVRPEQFGSARFWLKTIVSNELFYLESSEMSMEVRTHEWVISHPFFVLSVECR
jgi:hypothetical protein